jgi:adenylate cyclase class 2
MRYEVEQKHRLPEVGAFITRLSARGAALEPATEQIDRYFAHPCRDFARTDEALRIRTSGGLSIVTYKGPKLGSMAKTRQEIDVPLDRADTDGSRLAELLFALGFVPAATVRKHRRAFVIQANGRRVAGAVDDVDGLGTFVELELITDDAGLDAAQRLITSLAEELDLGPPERRSYLEMLLAK